MAKLGKFDSKLLRTADYLTDSPWRASLRYTFSGFPLYLGLGDRDKAVFEILKTLIMLGLESTVEDLKQFLHETADALDKDNNAYVTQISDYQLSKAFLEKLYAIFQVLAEEGADDVYPGILKYFKKQIHHFVEDHKLEKCKRIVNINKHVVAEENAEYADWFTRKYRAAKNFFKLDFESELDFSFAQKQEAIKKERELRDYYYIQRKLKKKVKNSPFRANYVVVNDADDFEQGSADRNKDDTGLNKKLKSLRPTAEPAPEKLALRKKKKIISWLAWTVTMVIAVGEGIAAGVLSGFPVLIALPTIGLAGGLVNYYLFMPYSEYTFRKFGLGRIFKDDEGRKISTLKKILILISSVVAFSGGAAFGFLSFHTATLAVTGLLAAASWSFPPAGVAVTAGIIATATAIALGCAFYVTLADIIANNRISQIKNFFIDNYRLYGWREATVGDWLKHITKCTITSGFIIAGVAITAVATIASFGLYHTTCLKFLTGTAHLAKGVSNWLDNVFIGMGTIFCFGSFNLVNNVGILNRTKDYLFNKGEKLSDGTKAFVTNPKQFVITKAKNLGNYFKDLHKHPFRPIESLKATVKRLSLLGSVVGNGTGQGLGMGDRNSVYLTHILTHVPNSTSRGADIGSGSFNSDSANALAVIDATAVPVPLKLARVTPACHKKAMRMLDKGKVTFTDKNGEKQNVKKSPTNKNQLAKAIARVRAENISERLKAIFPKKKSFIQSELEVEAVGEVETRDIEACDEQHSIRTTKIVETMFRDFHQSNYVKHAPIGMEALSDNDELDMGPPSGEYQTEFAAQSLT